MGKPRLIILIRHAQSEGNQNRQIHQTIPDHRVKLTPEGWSQAHEAGKKLRTLLRPSDTLHFYTSPYRRTRETTEAILSSLTSDDPEPSPFPRHSIKVWEEPRLREQDFGNFQPCSAAMERMWQERADYGHFFYRIPDGESAADAYDRISGFNETLWRQFQEEDFASVCVLVTHGLMTRVFLMKWYHWSVEYFEDLRNINHCEFVILKRNEDEDSGKFILQNKLRTWSELKRQRAIERGEDPDKVEQVTSPPIESRKRWGGCPEGCTHADHEYPVRKRVNTGSVSTPVKSPPQAANQVQTIEATLALPPPLASELSDSPDGVMAPIALLSEEDSEAFPSSAPEDNNAEESSTETNASKASVSARPKGVAFVQQQDGKPHLLDSLHRPDSHHGRDFGGTFSGAPTPAEGTSPLDNGSNGDYGFPRVTESSSASHDGRRDGPGKPPTKQEQARWIEQSGMGTRTRADALGDQDDAEEDEGEVEDVGGAQAMEQRKVHEADKEVDETQQQGESEEQKEGRPSGDVY